MILFYGVRWCIIISYSLKRFVYVVPRMLFSGASVEVVALSRISPSPSSTDPPVVPPANQVSDGITESSTDPPAVPPANLVGDAFAKRRPVGRFGGGSVTAGHGCGWVG